MPVRVGASIPLVLGENLGNYPFTKTGQLHFEGSDGVRGDGSDRAEHALVPPFQERLGGGSGDQNLQFFVGGAGEQSIELGGVVGIELEELAGDGSEEGAGVGAPFAGRPPSPSGMSARAS
jgi:hypothetical protein